mmetsp:Transcript_137456/g.293758  ORF Transcript_137456/g.293758 Transcript_137456/m.293758 type:complete len:104 (-) Transcript_137456:40-351(-)
MFGLRGINNLYIADGTGRDLLLVQNPDFKYGKESAPGGHVSAFKDTPKGPRRRSVGPRQPDAIRIETLHKGQQSPKAKPIQRAYSLPHLTNTWSAKPGAQMER